VNLERYLFSVIKPGRYIGFEYNAVVKDWNSVDVTVALCYPDLYEIGMCNYGINILYSIINRRDDALCERVFAVWRDFENILREKRISLTSLETQTELARFDIIGFSLEYELTYTNMITILDLAGIPHYSESRGDKDPIIIAGGSAMYNPEPVAAFLDAVVIGEGEEVIEEIIDAYKELKKKRATRQEILQAFHDIAGVYVPSLHAKDETVQRRYVHELKEALFPLMPIVPYISITHDRLTVEIMRGCTQGCRFCQAGFVSRPLREVPLEDIVGVATKGIQKSGWEEVSLLSLSVFEHSRIHTVIKALQSKLRNTSISLPSLRGDAITQEFVESLKAVRRSSLTLAPEAGTERLRNSMNKHISDDAILQSCEVAAKNGWKKLKLYFMVGLPTETSMDIEGIIELVKRIRRITGRTALKISISPFVPKPHTPFQWMAQDSIRLLEEKEQYVRRGLEKSGIEISWRKPEVSFLEAVFSRGDRSLSRVIEMAWNLGSRFEEWSEEFNFSLWQKAFDATGLDPQRFAECLKGKDLPWGFVNTGVKDSFLEQEEKRALESRSSANCMQSPCRGCGVCNETELRKHNERITDRKKREHSVYGRRKKKQVLFSPLSKKRLRVKYEKARSLRFISHLDTIRLIVRALRRANIDVAYTKGYRKRPRIAFGPPLPLGMTGKQECFDLFFDHPFAGDIRSMLNSVLPKNLRILDSRPVFIKSPSLSRIVTLLQYRVGPVAIPEENIAAFLSEKEIMVKRKKGDGYIEFNMRPFVHSLEKSGEYLDILIRFLPEGSVRLSEVLSYLEISIENGIKQERIAQFAEKEGVFIDPFDY